MTSKTEDKKRLLSNFISLSSLQWVNMVLPLVTLPYLVRVLGVDGFGLINLVLSIVMIFNILVSFGFDLSATREISINKDDSIKVSQIISSVFVIKSFMLGISLLILSSLVLFIDTLSEHALLYFVTFGIVIGNAMFPSWFYQGMERMKFITLINVSTKIFFTVLIFIFVNDASDYMYVAMFNSMAALVSGLVGLWFMFRLFEVRLILPCYVEVIYQLKASYHFFLSRVANEGARHYATVLIGLYFGNAIVGLYVIVDKLFFACMSIGGIVSQTIYPFMSRTRNLQLYKKIFIVTSLFSLLVVIFMLNFHEILLRILFDIQNEMLSNIFLIVFSGLIFGVVSSLIGFPLLAAFGYIKEANNSLIYASIVSSLYLTFVVIALHNIYLSAASIVIYSVLGLMLRVYYIYQLKIFKRV